MNSKLNLVERLRRQNGKKRSLTDIYDEGENTRIKMMKEANDNSKESSLSGILDIVEFFKENISDNEIAMSLLTNTGTSADTKFLAKLIINMAADVKKLTKEVQELKEIIGTKLTSEPVTIAPGPNFQTKYLLDLPLKTLEDFDMFDEQIKNDKEFRQDFVQSLLVLFDREEKLSRTFANMLRRYLSRELAMKFTATKQSATKLVFKDTNFCACMLDSMKGLSMNEKKFYQTLSSVFPNAKDWNGCRTLRRKAQLAGPGEDDEDPDGD
ncbi:hypothetical protein PV325_001192 [Microctonus aethiopoides]|nr:hypothetical protein PV325_001192 [Microctonus aethiopoides]